MYLTDGGNRYRLDLQTVDGWIVREIQSNETRTSTTGAIIAAIQRGELRELDDTNIADPICADDFPPLHLSSCGASPAALKQFLALKQWIDALHAEGITEIRDTVWVRAAIDRLAATTLADVKRFQISTLRNTLAIVRQAGGDWTQVVPRFNNRGGKGKTRTDPRAERIIQSVLDAAQNGSGRLVRTHIIDSVRARVIEHNQTAPDDPISMPGAGTIGRRVTQHFPAYEIHVRNSGRASANKRYRENSYPRDQAQLPLEISEYDDLDCGVFLINSRIGLPVGRAFLTHGVCQCTGVPLGFDLGHQPRNYDSAIGAICSSLLPKDPTLPEFGELAHTWIGYGVQGTMLLDNARYNTSRSTATAVEIAKLALAGTRPFGPTEKCSIEHYNDRTKTDYCSTLPGWRGDKADPESVKHAINDSCLDVVVFKHGYIKWVTGVYLNDPGEDGFTPKQRWAKHFSRHAPAVRWTAAQIALLRLRPMELSFRDSGGLKRLGLVYNSEALMKLRRDIGNRARVLAFVDNNDLQQILVQHPQTQELLRADYVGDPRFLRDLTGYQQKLILKKARERGKSNPGIVDMVKAREELQNLVDQARRSRKLTERRWAERVGDVPVTSPDLGTEVLSDTPSTATQPLERFMTELEWSIVQLEQVEIDLSNEEW